MDAALVPRSCRMACFALVAALPLISHAAEARSDAREGPPTPDGVCHPVSGTGYIVTYTDELAEAGLKIPVGSLSPLVEGDSLVVESGTITFTDFRNGQSSVYGAGTRLKIPAVIDPTQPTWWERLEDQVVRSLTDPARNRIGGSVRHGQASFWPDGGRFAPELPVVFEWWRVFPAPTRLQVRIGEATTVLEVSQSEPGSGALTWQPPGDNGATEGSWHLLDADGEPIGGGAFTILTKEEAEAERKRFRDAAGHVETMPKDLAAAILAAADRAYLW